MNLNNRRNKNKNKTSGGILYLLPAIMMVLGVLYKILLVRIAGTESVGYFGFAYDFYMLTALIFIKCIPPAVQKLVKEAKEDRAYAKELSLIKGALLIGLIAGLSTFILVEILGNLIGSVIYNNTYVTPVIRALAPSLCFTGISAALEGYFEGKGIRMPGIIYKGINIGVNLISGLIAVFILVTNSPASAAFGMGLAVSIGSFCAMLFMLFIYGLYRPSIYRRLRLDKSKGRYTNFQASSIVLSAALPALGSYIFYRLSFFLDSAFFARILSVNGYDKVLLADFYGIYSGEYLLILFVVTTGVLGLALPKVKSLNENSLLFESDNINDLIAAAVKKITRWTLPVMVGVILLATPILHLIFNESRTVAVDILTIGGVLLVLIPLALLSIILLQKLGMKGSLLVHGVVAFAGHMVFLIILLTFAEMNIFALIYSNIILAVIFIGSNLYTLYRQTGYIQELYRTLAIPTLSSVIAGILAYVIYRGLLYISGIIFISCLLALIAGTFVYILGLVVFGGMTEDELDKFWLGQKIQQLINRIFYIH